MTSSVSVRQPEPLGEASKRRRRRLGPRRAAAILAVLVLGYLAVVAVQGFAVYGAFRELRATVVQSLERGIPAAQDGQRAHQLAREARTGLQRLQTLLSPVLWMLPAVGWVPGWGATAAAAPALFQVAITAGEAGERAIAAALPVVLAAEQGANRTEIIATLAMSGDEFRAVATMVRGTEGELDRLLRRPGLSGKLASMLNDARGPLARGRDGLELAAALPGLLGTGRPVTYLLLGQNGDELRATGGFISTAGLVTFENGGVQALDYRDSYSFDPAVPQPLQAPPTPYQRYLLLQGWVLRDSNWWPDFPTSARQAEAFLWRDQERFVDGVIAFDQRVLQLVFETIGPIEVPAYGERVDETNFIEIIEAYAHPTGYKEGFVAPVSRVSDGDRKSFMTALAAALRARAEALDVRQLVALARRLQTALEEKHLLIHLGDPDMAGLVERLGWNGRVAPAGLGDYLMLIESNVSYNKANRNVERSLRYRVDLGIGGLPEVAELSIDFRNRSREPARHCAAADIDFNTADDSCYKSYIRVYAPAGTVPLSGAGLEDGLESFTEGGKTVLAGLLVLPPGTSKTVTLRYKPPRTVMPAGGMYSLQIQKQAGLDTLPLTVVLCKRSRESDAGCSGQRQEVSLALRTDHVVRLPSE